MVEPKSELIRNCFIAKRGFELQESQRAEDMNWINNRMDNIRTGQYIALIHQEADMEKEFQERTDHAAIVNAKAAYETKLAIEVGNVQREQTSLHQRRRFLRENDAELKDLAVKLRAGYVNRDLQQQILNKKYHKLQEKAEEKRTAELLKHALSLDQKTEDFEELEKAKRRNIYGQELRQQLVSRQLQKQCQYEDTLIEKKLLDNILRTISDEDKWEMELKRRNKEKLRQEMETFHQAKQAWRGKQKEMIIKEAKEIERQQQTMYDRGASIAEEKKRRMKEREEITAKIAAKVLEEKEAQQQREDLIKLLQEQELLEKNIQDDTADKQKFVNIKENTKKELLTQMEEKKKRNEDQRKKDEAYRLQIEAKMRAEEEAEKVKARAKVEQNKQHNALLQRQAADHRRRVHEAATDDQQRIRAVKQYQQAWQDEVAEERKKIIKEHAPRLIGYLQSGVIKKSDLPYVKEGASQDPALAAAIDVDKLLMSKPPRRYPKCNAQCMVLREY